MNHSAEPFCHFTRNPPLGRSLVSPRQSTALGPRRWRNVERKRPDMRQRKYSAIREVVSTRIAAGRGGESGWPGAVRRGREGIPYRPRGGETPGSDGAFVNRQSRMVGNGGSRHRLAREGFRCGRKETGGSGAGAPNATSRVQGPRLICRCHPGRKGIHPLSRRAGAWGDNGRPEYHRTVFGYEIERGEAGRLELQRP